MNTNKHNKERFNQYLMDKINYKTLTKEEYQSLFKNKDYRKLFEELKERIKKENLDKKIPIRGTIEILLVLSIFGLAIFSVFNWYFFNNNIFIYFSVLEKYICCS